MRAPADEVDRPGRGHVLVVDDDRTVAHLFARVLGAAGLSASVATTADEVVQALRAPFDGLVLDLVMPEVDGLDVLRALGAARRHQPVVLVTGAEPRVAQAAVRLAKAWHVDVVACLAKPCAADELRRAVVRMLGHVHARTVDDAEDAPTSLPRGAVADLIAADRVVAHFQPQVDLLTGEVVGFEALARLEHPSRGTLLPYAFLPAIAGSAVDRALTEEMLRQAARFRARRRRGTVSVNVAPALVAVRELAVRAQDLVVAAGVPPEAVVIEVTEAAFGGDGLALLDGAARLRLRGFGLSIDDFGTGSATLSRLQVAPVTELKIDRSFVRLARSQQESLEILHGTVELARRLGIRCVAEGIETAEDAALLRDLGCARGQGWWFGRPMTAEAALALP